MPEKARKSLEKPGKASILNNMDGKKPNYTPTPSSSPNNISSLSPLDNHGSKIVMNFQELAPKSNPDKIQEPSEIMKLAQAFLNPEDLEEINTLATKERIKKQQHQSPIGEMPKSPMSGSSSLDNLPSHPNYSRSSTIPLSTTRIFKKEDSNMHVTVKKELEIQLNKYLPSQNGNLSKAKPRLKIVKPGIDRTEMCKPIHINGIATYFCIFCQKGFYNSQNFNHHLNCHEDLRPFKCEHCNYQSRTKIQLKNHTKRHQGIREFGCYICDYFGITQTDLNSHKRSQQHHLKSQHVCKLCGLGFVGPIWLWQHQTIDHS